MQHDVVSGRALEVDQIFGDLVRRAEDVGVTVPRLTLIRDILRGLSGCACGAPSARNPRSWIIDPYK